MLMEGAMHTVFTLLIITIVVLYVYRKGWGDGHKAAYRCMINDLRKGQEMFGETGLDNWHIPEHWKKYEAGLIKFNDVVD